MRCVLVLCVALLAACGERPADHLADALAADPVRLKALRAQCAADRQATGEDACRAAAEAFRRRFFSGRPGRMNTRPWLSCHRSRRVLMSRPMVWRRSFLPNWRTRHE